MGEPAGPVKKGKVVPIIDPRLLETACGSAHDAARKLAGIHHYPLHAHEWDDLPRVTEYMSVKGSRFNVLQAYQDQLLRELIEQHRGWLPPEELPPRNKHPRLGKLLALVSDRLRGDSSTRAWSRPLRVDDRAHARVTRGDIVERPLVALGPRTAGRGTCRHSSGIAFMTSRQSDTSPSHSAATDRTTAPPPGTRAAPPAGRALRAN